MLLLKKTGHPGRYVVYDSGNFDQECRSDLLNRYVLKREAAQAVSRLLFDTLTLMKRWLPSNSEIGHIRKRFRVVRRHLCVDTEVSNQRQSIHVGDIVEGVS
jgi:hypothetical protein